MKKLLVMVIALAVVFGMSAGVMADELDSDSIGVNLTVSEYADVNFGSDNLELTAYEARDDAASVAHDRTTIDIKANTGINVTVRENLSRAIGDVIGEDHVSTLDGEWEDGGNATSIGVWLTDSDSGVDSDPGPYAGHDARYYWQDNDKLQGRAQDYVFNAGEGNLNYGFASSNGVNLSTNLLITMVWHNEWQELTAQEYEGTVEVIISGQ